MPRSTRPDPPSGPARRGRSRRAGPPGEARRLLRGMVHLRPAGGYRGLLVLEPGQARCAVPREAAMLPSATVWRLVESRARGVVVDVEVAEATVLGGETVAMKDLAAEDAARESAFA